MNPSLEALGHKRNFSAPEDPAVARRSPRFVINLGRGRAGRTRALHGPATRLSSSQWARGRTDRRTAD